MARPVLQAINLSVQPAGDGNQRTLAEQIPAGKLVEISGAYGSARLTAAVSIVLQAQREGETAAWVQPKGGSLFPPDLDESGVDLDSLVVVHVAFERDSYAIPKAAELLLRSGAFGLVVLDMTSGARPSLPSANTAWQGRLLGLAREHMSRVVCLTDTPGHAASLGPLVALRIEVRRARIGPGRFSLRPQLLKNKLGFSLEMAEDPRRAPWGLR
jgi:recombination protein RecA